MKKISGFLLLVLVCFLVALPISAVDLESINLIDMAFATDMGNFETTTVLKEEVGLTTAEFQILQKVSEAENIENLILAPPQLAVFYIELILTLLFSGLFIISRLNNTDRYKRLASAGGDNLINSGFY